MEEVQLEFNGGAGRGHQAAGMPKIGWPSLGGETALDGSEDLGGVGRSSELLQYVIGLRLRNGLQAGEKAGVFVELLLQLLDLGLEPRDGRRLFLFSIAARGFSFGTAVASRSFPITLESPQPR